VLVAQADEFTHELEQYGAQVIACPTIEIQRLDDYERLDEAISHLYGYDWLILTSVNAANYFFKRLTERGLDASSLDELKVCAIGEATAERLGELHVHVDLIQTNSKLKVFCCAGAIHWRSGPFQRSKRIAPTGVGRTRLSTKSTRSSRRTHRCGSGLFALLCRRTWIAGEWQRLLSGMLTAFAFTSSLQSGILLNSFYTGPRQSACWNHDRCWVTLRRRLPRRLDARRDSTGTDDHSLARSSHR